MQSNEILSPIEIAEGHVHTKVFDQDQASLAEVVKRLRESDRASGLFTAPIIVRLATVLRELGRGLRARYQNGEPLFTLAQEVLNLGAAQYAENPILLNEQGNLYADQGNLYLDTKDVDYDNAFESFRKVIDNLAADKADRLYAVENACASLRQLGVGIGDTDSAERFRQAKEILGNELEKDPDDSRLLNAEGKLYYDAEQYYRALASFQKVIKKDPPSPLAEKIYALENAVATLGELRRFNEADEMFQQALVVGGKPSASLLIERGWLEFYQQLYDLAFADFAEAERLAVTANSEEAKHAAMVGQIASRQAVDASASAENQDRAKDLMKTWRKEGLSQEEATAVLAKCDLVHTELNLYRAALLNDDLRLYNDPENQDALCARIAALKWLRRFSEAEDLYRQAQARFPANIELWKERGHIHYQQKQFQKAYEYYSGEAIKDPANAAQNTQEFKHDLEEDEGANEWTIVTLRKMRRPRDAENKVNQAIANIGERASFLCEKAYIYFTERKFDDAIALFDRALMINEYYEFAHQWRAAAYRKKLDFIKAKEGIDQALTKLPAATGIWEERAWIAFDQNQLQEADDYFATAIMLDPYLINRRFSRVEVLTRLNRNDDACKILLELKTEFTDDIEVAEQLGWLYLRRGEVDHADKAFRFIETKDSKNALGINGRGGYYLAQGDYVLAAKAFRRAIATVSYEPQYHVNRAWALVRQVKQPGEMPESQLCTREQLLNRARDHCRAALDLDEFDAKAHICLGVIAFKSGAFSDAEGYFRKSIELSPMEGGLAELGALYVQMGRYSEAEEKLTEAIKINGNDARAYIELANLRLQQDNHKEAVRQCRNAAAVEPVNDEAHRALAIALMRTGQYEEAERVLRKALTQIEPPKRWQLHLALSQILIRLGDDKNKDVQDGKKKNTDLYGEALNHVYEALRIHPSPSAEVFFHAGVAHFKLDDYKASRQSFDDCLKADRNRFEAERYGKLVQAKIEQEKKVLRVNMLGSGLLAFLSVAMLLFLWIAYSSGLKRTVPTMEGESAEARVKSAVKMAEAAKLAETKANSDAKAKETTALEAANAATAAKAARPAQKVVLSKLAETKADDAQRAAQAAKDAETAKDEAAARADAAVRSAASPARSQQEVIVDRQMLTVYTPMLLGLFVIALLLPNISKLKLFGGIEAEISEVKTEISSGPKGDVGFGSSLPIISPGPR